MRIMHLLVRSGFDKYKVGKLQCQLQIYQGAPCSALNATQSWTYRYANSSPTTVYRTKIFQPIQMYNLGAKKESYVTFLCFSQKYFTDDEQSVEIIPHNIQKFEMVKKLK